MLFTLPADSVDITRFCNAVQSMIDHHPIFRTVLSFDEDGRVVQCYDPSLAVTAKTERLSETEFCDLKPVLNRPVRMLRSPLIKVRLFLTESHLYLYLLSHHIAIDGSGLNILLRSLWAYYDKQEPATDTWFTYLDEEHNNADRKQYEQAKLYFSREYEGTDWCCNLKTDHNTNDLRFDSFIIQSDLTEDKLSHIKESTQLSPNELCAAVALLAMAETEGEENVMLHWVFQNRISPESENAAGLTIRLLPVGVSVTEGADMKEMLRQLSARIRGGIANSSDNWCLDNESVFRNDALFLVYEASIMDMESMKEHNAVTEILPNPDGTAVRRTALQILAAPDGLIFRFIYVNAMFEADHIAAFKKSLEKWIDRMTE